MKNIVFVNSLLALDERKKQIPLGILSLATILKENKYPVQVIDFSLLFNQKELIKGTTFEEDLEIMTDEIMKYDPCIVDFYTMCNSYHIAIFLAKKIKQINPKVITIFGGPQASLTAKKSLEAFPWVDVIGIGEGEKTILPLVKALIENKELCDIKGIMYRNGTNIIKTEKQELIENLDQLPNIDYTLMNLSDLDAVALDVGRGCPFGCTYCSTKTFWERKFRLKSASRLIGEIQYLINNYNIREFSFVHDLFTANKKKTIEFCQLVIEKKLDIKWSCSARVDTLDEEVIQYMEKAGCNQVYLGIESASDKMQKSMNKNLNIKYAYKIIKYLTEKDFKIVASFIYGFPDETLDDVRKSVKFIHKLKQIGVHTIQIHLLSIYPGTQVYEDIKDELKLSDNFPDCCETESIDNWKEELIVPNKDIFSNYYDFTSELRSQLIHLDKFIAGIYGRIFKFFNATFALTMKYYEDDLLNMFLDFKKVNEKELNDIYEQNNLSYIKNEKLIQLLNTFYTKTDFGKFNFSIREMFKFERDIIKFIYFSNEEFYIGEYDVDVYSIKNAGSQITERDCKKVKLKFNRIDSENIKIINVA